MKIPSAFQSDSGKFDERKRTLRQQRGEYLLRVKRPLEKAEDSCAWEPNNRRRISVSTIKWPVLDSQSKSSMSTAELRSGGSSQRGNRSGRHSPLVLTQSVNGSSRYSDRSLEERSVIEHESVLRRFKSQTGGRAYHGACPSLSLFKVLHHLERGCVRGSQLWRSTRQNR